MQFMDKTDKIFVAGHRGMVGSALVRRLEAEAFSNVVTRERSQLDLTDESPVAKFFAEERQNVVIHAAYENGVRKLLFLGSSCIYPKLAPQPIQESALLTGPLEPTNEAYAIAKIAGIKLCQAYAREYGANFISAMPTNLYGPNDNFDL